MLLLLAAAIAIPLGLDLYLPVPEDNPLTTEKIELGRRLFFDRRLSRDNSVSCSSCHDPERAFSDGRPVAIGVFGRQGRRNSPALINRGYGRLFFWDGRISTLEEQVLKPIQDPNEMDSPLPEAAARAGLPAEEISRALASYVRSILSGDSPFDRFINGDRTALSPEQQAGLQLFRGKANCTACHVGPNFTDERLHNTGVAWCDGKFADAGAGQGNFKTPTLREIARTAPYMHDGSLATLEEVIEYYDRGGNRNPGLDPELHALHLSPAEKREIVAFLGCLNGTIYATPHAATVRVLGKAFALRYLRNGVSNTIGATKVLPPSLNELQSRLGPFCQSHGVARLEVFGSVATGEAHAGSDIDLLIAFQPEVQLGWEFFALQDEMEVMLGSRVDLLTRRSVEQDHNPIRRRSILESAREIYAA